MRLPRTRGDGPRPIPSGRHRLPAPPHARGWTNGKAEYGEGAQPVRIARALQSCSLASATFLARSWRRCGWARSTVSSSRMAFRRASAGTSSRVSTRFACSSRKRRCRSTRVRPRRCHPSPSQACHATAHPWLWLGVPAGWRVRDGSRSGDARPRRASSWGETARPQRGYFFGGSFSRSAFRRRMLSAYLRRAHSPSGPVHIRPRSNSGFNGR